MPIPSRLSSLLILPAAVLVLGAAARVQAQAVLAGPSELTSGSSLDFTVKATDGVARVWTWTTSPLPGLVTGSGQATILEQAPFSAPQVMLPQDFQVQVRDAADASVGANATVTVLPGGAFRSITEVLGDRWCCPVPGMSLFAGLAADTVAADAPVPFLRISKLKYIDDPAMGPDCHRHWLVGDTRGLRLVSALGRIRPLAGEPQERVARGAPAGPGAFECLALAVRPQGSATGNPHHVVWAQGVPGSVRIRALDAHGTVTTLAGPGAQGPAGEAVFQRILDLAMDRDGAVYLLEPATRSVRAITPDGGVSTVIGAEAPGPDEELQPGSPSPLTDPHGMTLDPATGDLYLLDGDAVLKSAVGEPIALVLGALPGSGFEPVPSGTPVPEGLACLNLPTAIEIQGRHLFLADSLNHAVRVFNLDTRVLHTLLGHPSQDETRCLPLGHYSPDLALAECAAVAEPVALAFNAEGLCMLALPYGIVELDVPGFAEDAAAAPCAPTGAGEGKELEGPPTPCGPPA
jgi:hypothetical protein